MIKQFKSWLLIMLFSILQLAAFSQSTQVEMADAMRANGKIYVVIAVMLIVFAGVVVYLFRLERKLVKLEKALNDKTT